jgi:predicted HNH restriction endonuclease
MLCANCHAEIHANDDRVLHEELDLKLSRLKIELLNKSIIEGRKSAQDVFYSL